MISREIIIRRGAVFYEWKYREEGDNKWKMSAVPRTIIPPEAANAIAIEWMELHKEPIKLGWLLTPEEIEAGKKGIEWPSDI
jgi:hypothetical protein